MILVIDKRLRFWYYIIVTAKQIDLGGRMSLFGKEEKKVEYLELIYDLIFVYIIGRNNALLHHIENGFITAGSFSAYVFCTLAIIQIWMFSTFYINLYGKNSVRDHIFLFLNMYLLYHMSTGISSDWKENSYRFCIAWALILINIGVQHIIEARSHKAAAGVVGITSP